MSRAADPLLRPDDTCWRLEHARRAALLVDGEEYFAAVDAALEQARRSVLVVGWDLCSRVDLAPGDDARPTRLAERLDDLARRRPDLHLHLLDWNSPLLYAHDRESLPARRFGHATHPRVHFRLDGSHPFGGSQHQKLVVVDDRVAFSGGMDLTDRRWDTREHRVDDARRTALDGVPYPPEHDVQIMVDGDAAAALGDLARSRWRRAGGEPPEPPPRDEGPDPWPGHVAAAWRDVRVGISRTLPAWDGLEAVHEVQRLFDASLAAARRTLYLENQFLTSGRITRALARRLDEPDGPEVVLVLPQAARRWLEDSTMGVRQQRMLKRLRDADRHGRLLVRVALSGEEGRRTAIGIHAKVTVVDDRLLRVGSANLTRRSLTLDSECDLALEARGEGAAATAQAITAARHGLLAEHLGVEPERLAETVRAEGTLGGAVRALADDDGDRSRALVPLDDDGRHGWLHAIVPAEQWADPDGPLEPEDIAEHLTHDHAEQAGGALRPHLPLLLMLGALLLLTAAWRWTPLDQVVEPQRIVGVIESARGVFWLPLAATLACAVASMLLLPLAAQTLACVLLLGPWVGFTAFYVGMLAAAAGTWFVGRQVSDRALRRAAGSRLARLRTILEGHGVLTVAALRLIPLAPFGVVNAVAGHLRVPLGAYMLGTLLGMLPGTLLVVLFGSAMSTSLTGDDPVLPWVLLGLVALGALGLWALHGRWAAARPGDGPRS